MVDLRLHGDADVLGDGADLSVNVVTPTPAWLVDALRPVLGRLDAYPDARPAHAALAAHLGVDPDALLLTAGGAEGFTLLARLRDWARPVVVHPQFTEPEAALAAAGHPVTRVLCDASDGFALHPGRVPADADLVVIGNPTNPTSRVHAAAEVLAHGAPGRVLAVDEAFMDATDEAESLLHRAPVAPGLVVLRSLTKTFGIAGLRAGYLVAAPSLIARLGALQTPWSVGSLALAAVEATCTPAAAEHVGAWRRSLGPAREDLCARLTDLGFEVARPAAAPFVLARRPGAGVLRERLRRHGIAVRRGDTFPGLGPDWVRVAVRETATHARLAAAIQTLDLKES